MISGSIAQGLIGGAFGGNIIIMLSQIVDGDIVNKVIGLFGEEEWRRKGVV